MKRLLLLLAIVPAVMVQASSISFPLGLIPFRSITSETAKDSNGDMLVIGYTNYLSLPYDINFIPLPAWDGQTFSDASVELAPGLFFSNVWVPTVQQRNGNYSAFPEPLIDPYTGAPFVENIIPSSLLLFGVYAFEVGPSVAAAPEPATLGLLFAGLVAAVFIAFMKKHPASS